MGYAKGCFAKVLEFESQAEQMGHIALPTIATTYDNPVRLVYGLISHTHTVR